MTDNPTPEISTTYDVRISYIDETYDVGVEKWALFARGFASADIATEWAKKQESLAPHVWRVEPTHD